MSSTEQARKFANVSSEVPDISRLPLLKRIVIGKLGRLIMGQVHHLREKQTRFNLAVISTLESLIQDQRSIEYGQRNIEDEIGRLHGELDRLTMRLEDLSKFSAALDLE